MQEDDDEEAGVFGEVDTLSPCRPEHHLVEVKKEEESYDDGDVDSLCTTPPASPGEEVKCELEEEYPVCPTPASNMHNMPALAPRHQASDYWTQQPNVSLSPSQPFAAHGGAGMAGPNDVPSESYTAPPADPTSYYDGGLQSAHAPSQTFSQFGDPAGTASFYPYSSWFQQQQAWLHPSPAFSPYFGPHGASAATPPPEVHSLAVMQIQENHPPPASVPISAPHAPLHASPVPRLATPRDLVTPFISERDCDAAANVAFGNTTMGDCNPTTPGGAYRCPECPYIAPTYELLIVHHNARHRTSGLTEL